MTKPDITLEPSKGVISEMAAMIYSAHIIRGNVKEGEETNWLERSIRHAIRIAKTVDASVATEDPPAGVAGSGAPEGKIPAKHGATPDATEPTPAPSGEGKAPASKVDDAIMEALAGEDVPARK